MTRAAMPYAALLQPRDDSAIAPPQFNATPEQALSALREHPGPALIDLDETLFLRNSTELFIDCAWPGVFALLMLRALDGLKPWRWTGGAVTRDNWRAGLIACVLPWTHWVWRQRVQRLADDYSNQPLRDALIERPMAPVVVTVGFGGIVQPLCQAMGLGDIRVISCRLLHPADRRRGKLEQTQSVLGTASVAEALVLTDSPTDLPLLRGSRRGLLVQWPEARFIPALGRVYLPGQYISLVKHARQRYILRGILQEDFAFWILASVGLATAPLWHCMGLTLLLVSFWAIYERGYVDNDQSGARHETQPKLSPEFHTAQVATPWLAPWIWAAGAGVLGICALQRNWLPPVADLAAWAGVLAVTHLWFRIYNRVDKATRVWLYSGLQVGRTAAFAALVPVPAIGAAALAAHVAARWMPYYFYRHGGSRWLNEQVCLTRLMIFAWLAVFMALCLGWRSVANPTGLMLLAWNLFRARRELRDALAQAHRIDRLAEGRSAA